MKKLNKIPSKGNVYYDTPGGFNRDNGFVFSEALPYLKRRNKEKVESSRKRRKENVKD